MAWVVRQRTLVPLHGVSASEVLHKSRVMAFLGCNVEMRIDMSLVHG